ncbi:MAG: hypothetical protein SFV54_07930 [Bryobacteraceae bacterium]|nr:hypothetical protein [Bryobacteraceae bacterium]
MKHKLLLLFWGLLGCAAAQEAAKYDYKLLATTKTSTMEKELNDAAEAGFVFSGVMGGEAAFGGKEVIVIMTKALGGEAAKGTLRYKLLATNKTSTLEKEMREAGEQGFDYRGQTVFESLFGGREVAVIMERDPSKGELRYDYKLLATSKTSTMQKELREAGEAGYAFQGVMVGKTAFGGAEVVSIVKRVR